MVCGMNRALWLTMLLVACGPERVGQEAPAQPTSEEQPVASGTTSSPLTGFPCDVREVLQANCAGCHAGGYYVTHFSSREDLLQPARGDELLGAEVALRLRPDAAKPMPPVSMQKQPTPAERQLIDGWIQAGMPGGACGPLTR